MKTMDTLKANVLISILFAWVYMSGGPAVMGVLAFGILAYNAVIMLATGISLICATTEAGVGLLGAVVMASVGKEELENGSTFRLFRTGFNFLLSAFVGYIIIQSGFLWIGMTYIGMAGFAAYSMATLDDAVRKFVREAKVTVTKLGPGQEIEENNEGKA